MWKRNTKPIGQIFVLIFQIDEIIFINIFGAHQNASSSCWTFYTTSKRILVGPLIDQHQLINTSRILEADQLSIASLFNLEIKKEEHFPCLLWDNHWKTVVPMSCVDVMCAKTKYHRLTDGIPHFAIWNA